MAPDTSAATASPAAGRGLLRGSAFLALACVGLYGATFGPAMPFLAHDLGVSLDTAGLLLTAFFFGSISASSVVAVALHTRSSRLLGAGGLALIVAGALSLGLAPSWPLALGAAAVLGAGDGLVVAGLHILISRSARDVPTAVNNLNLFFALGAILGPLWAGGLLATSGDRAIVYAGIAAVAAVALLGLLRAPEPLPTPAAAEVDEAFRLPTSPVTLVMGAVLFMYVGAEFGLGSWVSSYARASAHAGVFAAAVLTAGFWLALGIGRVIAGVYFARKHDATLLLAVSAAAAGLSSLALSLAAGDLVLSAVFAFGAGLCLGPVWPATVAIVSRAGLAHDTAAVVTLGNAGGLVIPWAQGRVLVGAGPAQGVAVTAALCGLMFVVVSGFRFLRRPSRAA
ncbi:MAG: MFS transporter [Chloroflexota bacterium]|nr:MFS transporter [Chloroflexota bacterium]